MYCIDGTQVNEYDWQLECRRNDFLCISTPGRIECTIGDLKINLILLSLLVTS